MSKPIILYENEYVHVVNNETGELELMNGPRRFQLPAHKTLIEGKKNKFIIKDNQYMVVQNPFDKETGKNRMGQSIIVRGPEVLSLYPGEVSAGVKDALLLNKNEYMFVLATNNYDSHVAGETFRVVGPTLYFPGVYDRVISSGQKKSINIGENEAVYIRNTTTAVLKMVYGPVSYMLEVDEEEYKKPLSYEAYKALDLPSVPSSLAYAITIQKNEVVCVEDNQKKQELYLSGPKSHLLAPYESIRVVSLSGGVPKEEGALQSVKINLGPDIMVDSFNVRTRDNAVLNMVVTYKWKFVVGDADLYKIFTGDFIGYACQSMRSRVREAASRYEFERFHTSSSQILRETLFKDYEVGIVVGGKQQSEKFNGRFFREYSFLIFSVDVKEVKPVDHEIERLLDQSIKTSMTITCNKLNDNAETALEKDRIQSQSEVEQLKRGLIEIENSNYVKETIETARIEGAALIEKATAEAEVQKILKGEEIERELDAMKKKIALLQGTGGDAYLNYVKIQALHKNVSSVTLIPSDVKNLFLNSGSNGHRALEY